MSSFQDTEPDMFVTKRNGHRETMSFDKILKRIKKVGQEVNIKINYTSLAIKVIDQLYDGISTTQIDELTTEQCASLSSTHSDYNILAGRVAISNHHKNTKGSFFHVMKDLYNYKDMHGNHYPLISQTLYKTITHFGKEKIDSICDYNRDYLIDFFGVKTLERAYLMRINKKIVERPQHMWLRVSLGIHDRDFDRVIETYTYMSQKYFTHATPTLFNAGTPTPQLSSCYLMAMEKDSIDGIFNTLKDCALISKWAGGIGLHIHNVRASGSQIRGTNGTSNGIVPMLKVFNNTAKYVDQGGGKRNGSFAIYLEPWHADVEMFLQMRKNHGDEELKARDLFYALWVPDLFMKRVKEGKSWTLMCPSECPGLSDVIGDDFVTLYEKYETEGKGRSTIPARDLWFQILDSQMETGTPYLLFKDASNKKSNQQNLGVIKSSNLCVSPGTNVLTSEGQYPIYSLWSGNYTEEERQKNKTVKVWNGKEFSAVEIVKTGEDVKFVDVHTSDGMVLTCTPYHKFYIRDGKTQTYIEDAQNVLPGDLLEESDFPVIDGPETFPDNTDPLQEGCDTGVHNVLMSKESNQPLFVPINYNMKDKMLWLSGFIEPYVVKCIKEDSDSIRVPSISITFLEDLKYMLQTCGINTILHTFLTIETYTNHRSHYDSDVIPKAEWIITLVQLRYLKEANNDLNFKTFTWGFPLLTEEEKQSILMKPNVRILKVTQSDKVDDSYCFTDPISHAGIFNGIRTSQCTEIIEYSDENETAVCNLASIALPAFINKETNSFNFEELHKITRIVTRNLNKVIDINFYPTEKTKVSNMRHRPIGLGVQGLADVFLMLKLSFSCEEAKTINKYIFETIYHAALEESCLMSQEDGHYETFPGSPASNGLLQFDMWNVQPGNTRYDWDELKERIKLHGLRNSLLVAPMPTASTSQILGYNECIEPITSNIYSRRTLAGEFILVNRYLMQEMLEKDLWNETFKNHMVANNGSIQSLDYLSKELRERYRTVWEIPMKDLVDMAADRGAYICQSQSLNLWLEDPNYNTMTSMHFYSWQKGLKTGIYYLRRRPKHQAQQFTIEPNKQTIPREEEITCEMCSS
jgi:ribonucleoside-diphosphate reductase alpha chain